MQGSNHAIRRDAISSELRYASLRDHVQTLNLIRLPDQSFRQRIRQVAERILAVFGLEVENRNAMWVESPAAVVEAVVPLR